MLIVQIKAGENIDRALKRYKRKCKNVKTKKSRFLRTVLPMVLKRFIILKRVPESP